MAVPPTAVTPATAAVLIRDYRRAERDKPLDGPGHGQREVVQVEHLAQVVPAGWADGPQRVTAALELCHSHVLVTVRFQELQGTLGYTVQRLLQNQCKLKEQL